MTKVKTPGSDAGAKRRCVRGASKSGAQIVRLDPAKSVTDETRARFIAALAASSSVSIAAEEAGFEKATFYYHRRKDAGFAREWDEAKADAVERVEWEVVRLAEEALSGKPRAIATDAEAADARPMVLPPLTFEQAMSVIRLFRARAGNAAGGASTGNGSRRHWHWTPMDPEKAREIILRNVDMVRRARLAREAGQVGPAGG